MYLFYLFIRMCVFEFQERNKKCYLVYRPLRLICRDYNILRMCFLYTVLIHIQYDILQFCERFSFVTVSNRMGYNNFNTREI